MILLQKRIVRIIAGVAPRTHTEPLFTKLNIMSLEKLYQYNIGMLMYKYHHGKLPRVFDMFVNNSQVHSHYTRQHNLLHVPRFRTEIGKRSFNYQAVIIWNLIFKHIVVEIGIGTFKRRLKTFLTT